MAGTSATSAQGVQVHRHRHFLRFLHLLDPPRACAKGRYRNRSFAHLDWVAGLDPSRVLSEGEQTAAALADFLTEVELNGACVGVVFDDPVTSMDHMRKEAIAQRLVDEAEHRQVIIFTHDILFTNYLATAAEEKGVAFSGRTVWRNDAGVPGAIDRLAFPPCRPVNR